MRTPSRLTALASLVLLAACSSGSSTPSAQSLDPLPTTSADAVVVVPSQGPSASAAPRLVVTRSPAPVAASGSSPSAAAPAAPLTKQAPGTTAPAQATAPGSYTYDSSGTVTLGSPGTPQDASGQATLTVSPLRDGVQHSTLHTDSTGDTEEDLLVRDTGTYAASLKLTSPAFTKEFRPAPAVLLVPDPARTGSDWSWDATSTDGKTQIATTNTIARNETLTIGGQKVPCAVVSTHLVLSGDVDYTSDLTTWWAPELRLPVKTRTVGKGSYNGFPFSTDITAVMQSVTPA